MNKLYLQKINDNISDKVFFLILFIYQILFIFQGLDFADEGFHLTFYQQFFTHPESMVMNFMYWLTGLVGGAFFYLFPSFGILGLRVLGIIVIILTSITAYQLLKNYIKLFNLRIGILLVILFVNSNVLKEMYYDNLSALLAVFSAFLLFKGLINNKPTQIVLSGAFISLSMFSRLPGITLLIFLLAILYDGIINNRKFNFIVKQSFLFIGGFVLMTIAILLFMKLIGHLAFYIENLNIVFGWSGSTEDSHNIKQLITNFINAYSKSLIYAALLAIFLLILSILDNSRSLLTKLNSGIAVNVIKIAIILIFLYLILSNKFSYYKLLALFSGVSLIISILILTSSRYNKEIKLLVFIGCLLLLFAPLGSAGGLYGHGRNTFWIIFPIALDFIFNIKSIEGRFNILDNSSQENLLKISIGQDQLMIFQRYFIGMSVFACFYLAYYYPYFDMSDRVKMVSSIDNKLAKGIYTTKERAYVVNELLKESSKYVKKDDFVLAYDCIPLYHFLTETRPYMPNTWPWLYLPDFFKFELNNIANKSNQFPVIILQKVNTLSTDWPQNHNLGYLRSDPENERDSILNDFMVINGYIKVWENIAFEIRVPDVGYLNNL
jgi:hypothetical protein